jgi:hypothetical protein
VGRNNRRSHRLDDAICGVLSKSDYTVAAMCRVPANAAFEFARPNAPSTELAVTYPGASSLLRCASERRGPHKLCGTISGTEMRQEKQNESRGDWAERHVEEFLSLPFISEFVFRSVKTFDRSEKEVVDFMLMHGDSAILISQKAQDDPLRRTSEKNELWVRKNAKSAASQLFGAIRPRTRGPIWCEHTRRGRVEFGMGLPPIVHGIALAETFRPVDLQCDSKELPHQYEGIPISYFSINDFLNLVYELRSVPDILLYLNARRCLPADCLRVMGGEKPLFEYYLLNDGTLAGCIGHADAGIVAAAREHDLHDKLRHLREEAFCAQYLEYIADCLATRSTTYARGLSPEQVAAFDEPSQRRNYLAMQRAVGLLTLAERAQLGGALFRAAAKLENETNGFMYDAAHFTSRDWVFVLCASNGVSRRELIGGIDLLHRGAMAYYEKKNSLVIVDRDGESFEVGKSKTGYCSTLADAELGKRYFANLRTTSGELSKF